MKPYNNNIFKASAVALAVALAGTSCSDSFLDEKMYSNYGTNVSDIQLNKDAVLEQNPGYEVE